MQSPIIVRPFAQHTLRWWLNRRSQIDIDPGYQRHGNLWSDTDKAYLIDSILNGFDVPKIYLADFTFGNSKLNEKFLPYAVIDGKQRLEALTQFFEGNLVLNDSFVFLADKSIRLAGLGYKDLLANFPAIADRFDEYELQVMAVITEEAALINDLFVRLNRSKPLTGAEIRNAVDAPVAQVIRDLAQHEFIEAFVKFDTKRGQDRNLAAKILFFEYLGKPSATKKKDLDSFANMQDVDKENIRKAYAMAVQVLNQMTEIFLPSDPLLSSAGIIPVYYWFIRETSPLRHPEVRAFLSAFEARRKLNRELIKKDPQSPEIDSRLSEYDLYNRSTNDATSNDMRIKLLRLQFES